MTSDGTGRSKRGRIVGAAVAIAAVLGLAGAGALAFDGGTAPATGSVSGSAVYTVKVPGVG